MRERTANVLLLAAVSALCIGLAELVVRRLAERREVTRPDGERKALFNPYRPDASLSYALRPGWSGVHQGPDFRVRVDVNPLGMRWVERTAEKLAGAQRVLLLGDSLAFGWGVEYDASFAARLERAARVEVLDAAVPGYSADQHWIYLRERGFALAPDLILLAASTNDVDDLGWSNLRLGPDRLPETSASRRRFIAEDGRMHYLNKNGRPLPARSFAWSGWLAERSSLYTYLRYNALRLWLGGAERLAELRRERATDPPPEGPIESLAPEQIAPALASGAFRLRYDSFLVEAIRRAAAERAIGVATVLVGPEPGPQSDACAADPGCLDLSAQLSRSTHRDAYLPLDGHWNEHGHALAADAIGAWLDTRGLLRRGSRAPAAAPTPE